MKTTCGIILFNKDRDKVLALHPTGFPRNTWSIPKGEIDYENGESALDAAIREFSEETGNDIRDITDAIVPLGMYGYKKRSKTLIAYGAVQMRDFKNPITCPSTFEINGVRMPECDRHA